MTVEDAIKELQRLDPREELVQQNGSEINHILSVMWPLDHATQFGDNKIPKRKAVVFAKNPYRQ